jgi:hypothetical protein
MLLSISILIRMLKKGKAIFKHQLNNQQVCRKLCLKTQEINLITNLNLQRGHLQIHHQILVKMGLINNKTSFHNKILKA